jgi:hypothetical protein
MKHDLLFSGNETLKFISADYGFQLLSTWHMTGVEKYKMKKPADTTGFSVTFLPNQS